MILVVHVDVAISNARKPRIYFVFLCAAATLGELANSTQLHHFPMLRHVAKPLDAGGLESDVGVEAAGDGLVDDGLPLLLQQRDELLLGADVRPDAPVHVIQVADDGCLLGDGWEGEEQITDKLPISTGHLGPEG